MIGMKTIVTILAVVLLGVQSLYAQCTSPIVSGHAIRGNMLQGCAPFDLEIINLYSNSTADAVFTVNWGDGTIDTYYGSDDPVDGGFIDPIYTPNFTHTYQANHTDCGYNITIEATNPCTLPEDARIELTVSVWDTDWRGIAVNPGMVRVCQGFAANVTFEDVSEWNCYPRDTRQNDPPRWVQWIYDGGTIPVANIPGLGAPSVAGPVRAVMDPGDRSEVIHVPAQDPGNPGHPLPIGSFFQVTLNNWNQCNPPGNDPISQQASIVIVDTPEPDFVTHKDDKTNPVQTIFCINDNIYFENLTTADVQAGISYTWEFYDGPDTGSPLLATRDEKEPVFSYDRGGKKLIRLIAGDDNTVGDCHAIYEKVIDVFPTSIAQIGSTQTKFCKTLGAPDVFSVTFSDVSIGTTVNTEWKWEFYDENGDLIESQPSGGWSNVPLGPFTRSFSNPGVYKVKLYTKDKLTDCYTKDEVKVVIYNNPVADFANVNACDGDSLALVDQSGLASINSSTINKWEWDFNYDGTTFNPDITFNGTVPDTLNRWYAPGKYEVALRVTNDQNGCWDMTSREVEVYELPVAIMSKDNPNGCSPLEVNLKNNSIPLQPVAMDKYIWYLSDTAGFADTLYTDTVTDSLHYTFHNYDRDIRTFYFQMRSVSANGCTTVSKTDSVKVWPSIRPGFNYIDYDPFDNNCAPFDVKFQIDDSTRLLNPDQFIWTIYKSDTVVQDVLHYPADSIHMTYHFTTGGTLGEIYEVNLSATKPGICIADSTLKVRVNPVPVSDFTIDTLDINCDYMRLKVEAVKKGLAMYDWTVHEGPLVNISDTLDESFIYTVKRPGHLEPDVDMHFELRTVNFALCASEINQADMKVPALTDLQPNFTADPALQTYPNTTVTIHNSSRETDGKYLWDFDDSYTTTEKNPVPHVYERSGTYTIRLRIEDLYCVRSDSVSVTILPTGPIPDFSYDPEDGCAPLTVHFKNLTKNANENLSSFTWNFGDNQSSSHAVNPTYTFHEPGIYSVRLEVTNQDSLTASVVKEDIISVYPSPAAVFEVRPLRVTIPDDPIYITNFSERGKDYLWNFGDGHHSNEFEPSHIYTDTGRYDISLIVISENGCTDSVTKEKVVQVTTDMRIQIPNVFTPNLEGPTGGYINADGRNDIFYPITEGVLQYKMQIYNRWGELIYETQNTNQGWDGYYKGKICPQDVYVYKIDFKMADGSEITKFGDITLIR